MKRVARRRGPVRRAALLILICALAVLAAGGIWTLWVPVGSGPPVLISVQPGDSASDVAAALWQSGLIRNANALVVAAYLTGKWRRIQAGRHELDPGMTALDMLDALCRGSRRAWRWITIPEGYTLRQTADKVQAERLGKASEFLRVASAPLQFEVAFPLPGDSLEGYLFPDTYRVDAGESERDIVVQMLRRFEEVVWKGMFGQRNEYGERTLREIIVLASLVEGEAKRADERSTIAGILVNRLERGQKLECDATVQYALGEGRKARLTYDDLSVESEYNTYLHPGLPPGPICSPGEASIRAAMNPAKVPYLYYVARPDGSHVLSTTFPQHQQAIVRLRGQSR